MNNSVSKWRRCKIEDVAEVNPRRPSELSSLPAEYLVTFVPMASISEYRGEILDPLSRPLSQVKTGYTYFAENDVLLAKITPCMQNGKAAIARNLKNQLGFGSTEFHVLRAKETVVPEWLFYFVRQKSFRDEAATSFKGSAGQQRVPSDFLQTHEIPIPPIEEQHRIVTRIKECTGRVEEIESLSASSLEEATSLFPSLVEEYLAKVDGIETTLQETISISSVLIDPKKEQYRHLKHVGGGNIVSGTGEIKDVRTAAEENMISGKFLFTPDDVLYCKIRPYLKKVARPDFNGLCSADMYPLRPKAHSMTKDFLFYCLLSRRFTNYAIKASNRAGMPKINRDQLFSYHIQLPNLEVQKAISSKLDRALGDVLAVKGFMQERRSDSEALRGSVLRKAFAGEL